jgi:putative flippase GtrA
MTALRTTAEKLHENRLLRFLAVGALNTLFGYCVFSLLVLSGLAPGVALAAGTVLGLVFNYFTTGRLVFAARGLGRLPWFIAVNGLTFLINLWSLRGLIAGGLSPFVAQAIVLPIIILLSFALNKLLVFRGAT